MVRDPRHRALASCAPNALENVTTLARASRGSASRDAAVDPPEVLRDLATSGGSRRGPARALGGRRLGAFSWLGSEALVTRFAGRGSTAPVARFAGLGSACPSRRCLGPPARAVADQATWPKRSNDGQVSDPQPAARDLRRNARPRPTLSTRPTARVRNLRPRRPRATRARKPPATGARERLGASGIVSGAPAPGAAWGRAGGVSGRGFHVFLQFPYSSHIVPK